MNKILVKHYMSFSSNVSFAAVTSSGGSSSSSSSSSSSEEAGKVGEAVVVGKVGEAALVGKVGVAVLVGKVSVTGKTRFSLLAPAPFGSKFLAFLLLSFRLDSYVIVTVSCNLSHNKCVPFFYLWILEAFSDGIIGHEVPEPSREDDKKRV